MLAAMNAYREVHGESGISRDYVVPTSEPFSQELWGMKLGLKVNNIRYRGDRPRVRKNLEQLGFSLGKVGFDTRHWEYVYKALVIFKDQEGHIDVPRLWLPLSEYHILLQSSLLSHCGLYDTGRCPARSRGRLSCGV